MSETSVAPVTMQDYAKGAERPTWCPGCGDFSILGAIKMALVQIKLPPHEVLMVSGIGCGSKLPHYLRVNEYDSLHGRALPVATGAKLANHALKVIAVSGDGDGLGIGGNHLIHSMRRNPDITHVIENNQTYGLTKGQYSPTSEWGYMTSTSPEGCIELAVNTAMVGLAMGATFIGRTSAGDVKHMTWVLAEAIKHHGYSIVDVLQPCVTFNKVNTYEWYKARAYKVNDDPSYDSSNRDQVWQKAKEWGERIPIGVIYQEKGRPTYEDQVTVLKKGPLAKQPLTSPELVNALEKLKEKFV